MSNYQPEPTRADYALSVHECLHALYQEAIQGKTIADVVLIQSIFNKAVEDNIAASGIRVNTPKVVNTIIEDDRASLIAFAIKNTQAFLRTKFKDNNFTISIPKPRKKMRNIVDWQIYEHLATVQHDQTEYVFAVSNINGYVLSEKTYWEDLDNN